MRVAYMYLLDRCSSTSLDKGDFAVSSQLFIKVSPAVAEDTDELCGMTVFVTLWSHLM